MGIEVIQMNDKRQKRKELRKTEELARINDIRATLAVCREIRDNPAASPSERIEAIKLIQSITKA